MPNKSLILSCLLLFSLSVMGQERNIRIGRWRVHLPYTDMQTLAVGPGKVYAAKGSSVLNYDRLEGALDVDSKYTGLNDVSVSQLGYNSAQETYIVGYETGNIDLIKGNVVINANDIVRNTSTGSKKINHILSKREFAYISGDYGLVLYDVANKEVKESYLTLSSDFSSNPVYASALNNDSIFLATSKGVMCAKVSQTVNLMDFSNWYTFQIADSIDTLNVVSVCAHAGIVYAAVMNKGIYYYNGSKWRQTSVPMTAGGNIFSLTNSSKGVLACVDTSVFLITNGAIWKTVFHQGNINPNQAYYDSENTLWIATSGGGLIEYKNGNPKFIYHNGPLTNKAFRFGYYNNTIVELAGGYNSIAQRNYSGNWWSYFENNIEWKIGMVEYPTIPSTIRDVIGATYNSINSTLYLSSYGEGLVAIGPDKSVKKYNDLNSNLLLSGSDVLVGETAVDNDGNLWIPNHVQSNNKYNFHRLSADGVWEKYIIPGVLGKNAVGVTIDDYNNKWIRAAGTSTEIGIVVFNEKTGTRTLSNGSGQGGLPDINVNCVTKDKKGTMFVGTNQGIGVCYDPSSILNSGVDLVKPIFEGFPLLYERNVLAIEVDGGNRKWVGTNDGLWLFNEDMTQVIEYFDTDNSPLLSDYILDIEINDLSGEVFFATPEGIISYRGTATEGDDKYSDVKVFPNPVKPDFNGLVGISGLAAGASVKITDVSGNLVYETTAQGGTAVWNVKDYNGRRATTGIYLIFCATVEGSNKFVSKIAVLE